MPKATCCLKIFIHLVDTYGSAVLANCFPYHFSQPQTQNHARLRIYSTSIDLSEFQKLEKKSDENRYF